MNLVHYVIVRRDLPLGVMSAMLVHAAGESATLYWDEEDGRFRHATAVVLEARSEKSLLDNERYLRSKGIQYVAVLESGGVYDGQLMALGLVPAEREELEPHLTEFQVLKALDEILDNPASVWETNSNPDDYDETTYR